MGGSLHDKVRGRKGEVWRLVLCSLLLLLLYKLVLLSLSVTAIVFNVSHKVHAALYVGLERVELLLCTLQRVKKREYLQNLSFVL